MRQLTNATAVVTDTYDYDAFGNLISRVGTTANDYLYTGEQFDANLRFYYLRARYMNSSSGRFFMIDSYEGSQSDPGSLHSTCMQMAILWIGLTLLAMPHSLQDS